MWWDYPFHDWDYNPTKNPIDQRERNLSYRIYYNLFGIVGIFGIMWIKQCHKPPMTGNGLYIPAIKVVMTGGWFMALFYPHY